MKSLSLTICCSVYLGQELPPPSTRLKCPRELDLYDMAGQVSHKRAFIKQYVPANRKLFLIGHSLGAKVVSELLKDSQIADHTRKCYLLMPTLERIGDTPNGRFLTRILAYGLSVTLLLAWVSLCSKTFFVEIFMIIMILTLFEI